MIRLKVNRKFQEYDLAVLYHRVKTGTHTEPLFNTTLSKSQIKRILKLGLEKGLEQPFKSPQLTSKSPKPACKSPNPALKSPQLVSFEIPDEKPEMLVLKPMISPTLQTFQSVQSETFLPSEPQEKVSSSSLKLCTISPLNGNAYLQSLLDALENLENM